MSKRRVSKAPLKRQRSASSGLMKAIELHKAGRTAEALPLFERAAACEPRNSEVQFLLGGCLRVLGREADARAPLEESVRLDPLRHRAHHHLGEANLATGRFTEARANMLAAVALEPSRACYQIGLAKVFAEEQNPTAALGPARAAVELDQSNGQAHGLLGWACEMTGDADAAEHHYLRSAALDERQLGIYYRLARMKRFDRVDSLRALLGKAELLPNVRAILHFAIGEILHQRGDYEAAFSAFAEGNRLVPARYNAAARTLVTTETIAACGAHDLARHRGHGDPTEAPIFIVGMPRSGSSLVEQILAAHPDVQALGECTTMPTMAVNLRERTGRRFPAALRKLDQSGARELAAEYLQRVGARTDVLRHTDKSPANFLYLGLIATLFPNARVIHTRRNPLDTCLSSYFTCFGADRLSYSNDMEHLASFYRDYARIMEHWRTVEPLRMLEVDYETLVTDGEPEMRRIVEFVGLPWSAACTSFHQLDRVCQTASRHQVNQKLHTRGCGRWKNYAAHLGPWMDL